MRSPQAASQPSGCGFVSVCRGFFGVGGSISRDGGSGDTSLVIRLSSDWNPHFYARGGEMRESSDL